MSFLIDFRSTQEPLSTRPPHKWIRTRHTTYPFVLCRASFRGGKDRHTDYHDATFWPFFLEGPFRGRHERREREQTFSKTSYSTTTNQLETSPEVVKVEVIITGDEEEEEEEDNGEELERWRETITNETGRW